MLDRETVERLLQNNLDAKLNSELSKYGYQLDAAHKLFRFITSIFERTPPELITWKFKVIMPVGDWDFSQKIILNFHRMNEVFTSECAFIIVDSNLYLIEPYEADYSGRDHICYQYNAPQNESLTIKDKQFQLSEYYDSAITSIFAQPTYKELDEAMDYYNTRYVRDSSCAVLSQIWTDEAKREFVQKPEHFMRDSLWQCLQNILRNHTVKREQIVDATHPVDIKVTWPAINNVALIEVKWLGDSGQTQYRDARANEGAKQLIDYLASSVQEEPDKHFVGYLTVFDGRRGKTSNQYERQEINYRSEYSSHPSMNYRRFYVADGLFCREIDGLFCRSSPDIIVRRRCVLSHKRRGWLQPSPSFRYSRNLALQDELYHPVINNGPAVLVCVDKRLGTGPVNQSRDAG